MTNETDDGPNPALCRMCGMPVHRYSPDHAEHGPQGRWDAMGCVNMLRPEVERLRAENETLRETVADLYRLTAERAQGTIFDRDRMSDAILRHKAKHDAVAADPCSLTATEMVEELLGASAELWAALGQTAR